MIRLARPETEASIDAVRAVLKEGMLVQGKNVRRFEEMVASFVGRRHAVAVNSGTSAIHCALLAAGVGEGDEVIVPDFTFPATANAVVACGATPVLADIDPASFNLDPAEVKRCRSGRTKAVMPVDLFGLPADLPAVEKAAGEGVVLIEDSACALGSARGGRMCGAFGAASIISFHPRKVITTGEGGMVLTDNPDWAAAVRRLRNHGMDSSRGVTEFVSVGYNLRLNEIQACLGIVQMTGIEALVEKRRRIAHLYDRLLADIDEIRPPAEPEGCVHSYQSYVVMLAAGLDRDAVISAMRSAEVETAIGTYAIHHQPFYVGRYGYKPGSLPVSSHAFRHSLALPIYSSMEEETAEEVVARLKECVRLP
jgi:perosamine synthetase